MNIQPKDKVLDLTSGSIGTVIATHTYSDEGVQVASVKTDTETKWVAVSQLKKVES